jgi:hypothetical protein
MSKKGSSERKSVIARLKEIAGSAEPAISITGPNYFLNSLSLPAGYGNITF